MFPSQSVEEDHDDDDHAGWTSYLHNSVNGQLATLVSIERANLSNPQEAAMSGTIQKASDIFIVGLRNQHAVESQAIELLERQVSRLENYPEMIDRMRRHI